MSTHALEIIATASGSWLLAIRAISGVTEPWIVSGSMVSQGAFLLATFVSLGAFPVSALLLVWRSLS